MEELKFTINLNSTAQEHCPELTIYINDKEYFKGEVFGEQTIEFDAEVDSNFDLCIAFDGNDPSTFVLDKDGLPTNTIDITIKEVLIDGIDITQIAFAQSKFTIDKDEPYIEDYELIHCMDFGFKGVWSLSIEIPVYVWILENL